MGQAAVWAGRAFRSGFAQAWRCWPSLLVLAAASVAALFMEQTGRVPDVGELIRPAIAGQAPAPADSFMAGGALLFELVSLGVAIVAGLAGWGSDARATMGRERVLGTASALVLCLVFTVAWGALFVAGFALSLGQKPGAGLLCFLAAGVMLSLLAGRRYLALPQAMFTPSGPVASLAVANRRIRGQRGTVAAAATLCVLPLAGAALVVNQLLELFAPEGTVARDVASTVGGVAIGFAFAVVLSRLAWEVHVTLAPTGSSARKSGRTRIGPGMRA